MPSSQPREQGSVAAAPVKRFVKILFVRFKSTVLNHLRVGTSWFHRHLNIPGSASHTTESKHVIKTTREERNILAPRGEKLIKP